jgi:GNAT superfamily N-acetyltransferase
MLAGDAQAVVDLGLRTLFTLPEGADREAVVARQLIRVSHVRDTDPGGAWVAEAEGRIVGAALALVRERVWGLSFLAVDEDARDRGLGRALLDAALGHGEARGARGWIILSTEHPAAMRRYANAGFALHPALAAAGIPDLRRAPAAAARVREGGLDDVPLADELGRLVRGAGHGPDLRRTLEAGLGRLLLFEDRAFALEREGYVMLLAARDEEAARIALWGALAAMDPGRSADVLFLTAAQGWAVRVLLDARLALTPDGPVFLRGELGPMTPYLPSGAYL